MQLTTNHPARVAERISTLDLVSKGRVEFGMGESATTTELHPFDVRFRNKRDVWEDAVRACLPMQSSVVPASARWRATKGSLDAYRGLFFHGMSKLFTMNTSINFAHNSSRMNTCDLKDLKYLKNEYFRRKPRGEGRIVMFMLEFQTGPLMSASDRSIQ